MSLLIILLTLSKGASAYIGTDLPLKTNTVLNNVNVISVTDGVVIKDQAIVINNNRIVSIEPRLNDRKAIKHGLWIEGNGRFVIPGLWDMHVHIAQKERMKLAPLFIANGVTGVREMISQCQKCGTSKVSIETLKAKNKAFSQNEDVGPRILQLSNFANKFGLTSNDSMIKRFVDNTKKDQIDFIKVYSGISRADFLTLAKYAKEEKLHLAGHVPNSMTLEESVIHGMRSIEHVKAITLYCGENQGSGAISVNLNNLIYAMKHFNKERCNKVFNSLKENETYYVPTHLTSKMPAFAKRYLSDGSSKFQFIDSLTRWAWQEDASRYVNDKLNKDNFLNLYRHGLKLTKRAYENGVQLMVGTDTFDSFVVPGFSVHDELEEFTKAGLSPLIALQAATINSANFLGLSNDFGTVEVGRYADFIVLNNNPLLDIKHSRNIEMVFYNGRQFDRADINKVKDDLKFKRN